MSNLLNELSTAVETSNDQEISKALASILETKSPTELFSAEIIKQLLKLNKPEVLKLTSEVVAEWAKIESNRKLLTDEVIIDTLLKFLKDKDYELCFETVRALGNICYENEEACNIIEKSGIDTFLSILKDDETRKDEALTIKISGLLINLFNLNDGLIRAALKHDVISILEKVLLKYSKSFEDYQMLLTYILTLLNMVCDYLDELNITLKESLCQIVIDVFKKSSNPEISVPCLEIFHGQSEKDEMKTWLANGGVCELLFDLIEKHGHEVNDDDTRSILKMACDLIVVILTGDDCMYLLYDNGKGIVYLNMVSWLDTDDSDLISTGVLAIGNFARKDVHCIQMVRSGISKKLIDLLSKYNNSTDIADVKIQHALLSTLKNLVIPAQNKTQVLQEGLIDVIYPMIQIDQYSVIFKLLGTFRMVIDGQEAAALDLISRRDFIEKFVHWSYNSDHLGVRGEVPRLLVWLIKNCHSFKPFKILLDIKDSIKCLVEMISSNHAVMQNEALYALNLLCVGAQDNDKLMQILVESDIGKNVNFVMLKYGEKMDQHTIENLLTLLEQLIRSQSVLDHFNDTRIKDSFLKIFDNPKAHDLKSRLEKVTQYLTG